MSYELHAFETYERGIRYCISEDGYLLRFWFSVAPVDNFYIYRWERCPSRRISVKHSCYPRAELVYECGTIKDMEEYIEGLILIGELKK